MEIDSYLSDQVNGEVKDPMAVRLLKAVMEYWKQQDTRDATRNATDKPRDSNIANTLLAIENRLKRIEEGKMPKNNSRSYAAVAAKVNQQDNVANLPIGRNTSGAPKGRQKKDSVAEERKNKELVVKINSEKEREIVQNWPTKSLLEALQKDSPEIVAVNRLNSGDLKVITRTESAKNALQSRPEWTRVIAPSAALQIRTFSVTAHGIRVQNVNTADQAQAIDRLHKVSSRLHPGLRIVRVSWSAKAIRERKIYSSLRLEIATAEMANSLVSEGMIEDYELKVCERSLKECRIIQCFNCWEYGHIAKACRHQTRCGHCAYAHETNFCDVQDEPAASRCAACGATGHKAWSARCEIRRAEKKKSETALNAFPVYYKTAADGKTAGNETGGKTGQMGAVEASKEIAKEAGKQADQHRDPVATSTEGGEYAEGSNKRIRLEKTPERETPRTRH